MIYRKLKRTWSHNNTHYIPGFKQAFPELNKVKDEELADRFCKLNVNFFTETEEPVRWWVRFTLPFALVTILLMFIGLPIAFLITGRWGLSFNDNDFFYNWFKSLGLQ